MGIGVEIDRPATGSPAVTPPTQLNWLHKDRLGSPIAISGETGALRERLAYDAWGKRRTTNGAATGTPATPTPDTIDGVVDNRGFTGHEMLDQLDLVHMNGRIYDPLIGRFLSADPILQDPMNGQSYNRYSYVMNNPTNFTDPTGFSRIEKMNEDRREREQQRFETAAAACKNACYTGTTNKDGTVTIRAAGDGKGNTAMAQGTLKVDPKQGGDTSASGGETASTSKTYSASTISFDASQVKLFEYRNREWTKELPELNTKENFINGMMNTVRDAQDIAEDALRIKKGFSEFGLLHIPSKGFGGDLARALMDKLGFTTETAKAVAGVMALTKSANWYAHSYGGVAVAEGIRAQVAAGREFPAGHAVTFLAAANNQWVTSAIMAQAGVQVNGYPAHWLDSVANLAGFNTLNPIKIIANVLAAPFLFTPYSVHTYPPVR
ncbi:MAG: hypothetical protein ING73_16280 [Rhodocyclaceae bacterium]|nr:hypothetical protein [Rhodocyclaceae bacterium]